MMQDPAPPVDPEPAPAVEQAPEPAPEPEPVPEAAKTADIPQSLREMVQLFESHGELLLASTIRTKLRPVVFEPGRFEFSSGDDLAPNVPAEIAARLLQWTGLRWIVAVASDGGGATIDEQDAGARAREIAASPSIRWWRQRLMPSPGRKSREVRPLEVMPDPEPDDNDDDDTPARKDQPMRNLAQMMQKAKAVQENIATMKAELEAMQFDGESGGGAVRPLSTAVV